MATTQPRYSKEEFACRGEEIYEREIQPKMQAHIKGQFVAIDIETGAFEVDADELKASDRLLARVPNAQIWLRRVDSRYARRFGHPLPSRYKLQSEQANGLRASHHSSQVPLAQ